jgi:hypothetical protein
MLRLENVMYLYLLSVTAISECGRVAIRNSQAGTTWSLANFATDLPLITDGAAKARSRTA